MNKFQRGRYTLKNPEKYVGIVVEKDLKITVFEDK